MSFSGRIRSANLFALIAAALVWGCGDGGGGGTPSPAGSNPTGSAGCGQMVEITADVTTPTTWTADNVYVIRKFDFYVTSTLSIQPGTVIKFHPSDGPYMMLGGAGSLSAIGTAADPIVFTSYRDDANGCDTNGDSGVSLPAAGDWDFVNVNGTTGSTFSHCRFLYGGGSATYDSTLDLFGSTSSVTNCTFANNTGMSEGVLDAADALAGTTIQSNIFYANGKPLTIESFIDLDDSNIFHDPANPSITNESNGIFLWYRSNLSPGQHTSWGETEVAFVIDNNDFWIDNGASLTVGANVVIKFTPASTLSYYPGGLVNFGGPGVSFTSIMDDSRKGDTNGDGSATIGQDGDWNGIWNDDSGVYMGWGNILYDSY